ncbi:hypothetical protein D3C86_1093880 [compost metagenome]
MSEAKLSKCLFWSNAQRKHFQLVKLNFIFQIVNLLSQQGTKVIYSFFISIGKYIGIIEAKTFGIIDVDNRQATSVCSGIGCEIIIECVDGGIVEINPGSGSERKAFGKRIIEISVDIQVIRWPAPVLGIA